MKPMSLQKRSVSLSYGLGIAQVITGIPVAVVSLVVILLGAANFRGSGGIYYVLQFIMMLIFTGGGVLIYNGAKSCRLVNNYRKLSAVMEYKNRERIPFLAQATGQRLTGLVRDLRVLSDKGYFPQSYIDLNRNEFVLASDNLPAPALRDGDTILKEIVRPSLAPLISFPYAFAAYLAIKPFSSVFDFVTAAIIGAVICTVWYYNMPRVHTIIEKKYKTPPPPDPVAIDTGNDALDELLTAAMTYMGQLTELSLSITGEKMSRPVNELLETTRQIFAFIEKQPEKIKQIRQFMNYYLPTTIKLLQSYSELSRQRMKSGEIAETLVKIEGSMDEIVRTFKRELDNLYRDKAEDIGVDIDIMLAMMRQRGISDDFGIGNRDSDNNSQ